MTDMINPAHYHGDRNHEPIDVIEDWGLNYRLGCALKYIARNGRKPGEDPREGLKKAIWYLEREIASLESPSQYSPPADVQYEDVLDYYGQTQDQKEAWPDTEVPFSAGKEDWEAFWDEVDSEHRLYVTDTSTFLENKSDALWDPSLGPVELSDTEIAALIDKKDLEQFAADEIVSTVEKRGFILGIKKDGSTCVLRDGRCQ